MMEKDSTKTNTTEDEKMDDVFHTDAEELAELNSKGIMSERVRVLRELGDGDQQYVSPVIVRRCVAIVKCSRGGEFADTSSGWKFFILPSIQLEIFPMLKMTGI